MSKDKTFICISTFIVWDQIVWMWQIPSSDHLILSQIPNKNSVFILVIARRLLSADNDLDAFFIMPLHKKRQIWQESEFRSCKNGSILIYNVVKLANPSILLETLKKISKVLSEKKYPRVISVLHLSTTIFSSSTLTDPLRTWKGLVIYKKIVTFFSSRL